MNGRELLEAMSFIDEDLIAASEAPPKIIPWKRWGALAACLAVLVMGSFAWLSLGRGGDSKAADTALFGAQNSSTEACMEAAAAPEAPAETLEEAVAPAGENELASEDAGTGGESKEMPDTDRREAVLMTVLFQADGTALVLETEDAAMGPDVGDQILLIREDGTPLELEEGEHLLWLVNYDRETATATVYLYEEL